MHIHGVCTSQAYPALLELVTALQGLPYELNAKAPALGLSVPLPGSIMLSRLPPGAGTPRRLHGSVGGQATGFVVTALYFIAQHWEPDMGGQLLLTAAAAADSGTAAAAPVEVEPLADRLVLFKSRDVWCERTAVRAPVTAATGHADTAAAAQWTLTFWMHGSGAV